MRATNKLLSAALTVALTIGGLGVLFTPISANSALPSTKTPNVASLSPAAVNECSPGYQEGFDVVNNKWLRLIGDVDDVVLLNSKLVEYLDNSGDIASAITADTFSGDFVMEVDITSISGFDKTTDSLSFWIQAIYNGDNYFGMSSTSGPSTHTIKTISMTGGVANDGENVALGPTYDLPLKMKIERSGTNLYAYYVVQDTYVFVGSTSGITSNDVYITLNSQMTTSASHSMSISFDSFRHGCELPTFTSFDMNGGLTSTPVSSVVFNNRMYQFIGGNSAPNKIYMRSTDDGTFNGDLDENWVHFDADGGPGGETATEVGTAVFNNRLYIAVKGRDSGQVFTKSMGTDGEWDATWNENGGKSGTAIAMAMFNPGSGDRLYQVIRGFSSNNLYYRYTTDGTFDGSAANESWATIMNQGNVATTPNAPAIETFFDRLYISVRGSSGNINYASTADGEFDSDASDEYFILSGGKTTTTPTMEVHNFKLYQATKGNSTDLVYTRYFTTDDGWSEWYEYGGKTPSRLDMTSFNGVLHQTARGNSGNIFMRLAMGDIDT